MHTDQELLNYRLHVEQMFNEKSSSIISNRSTDHARILIETLISRSETKLDIFCQNLCSKVYGTSEIGGKLAAAGIRGVKVRILTQNDPEAIDLENTVRPYFVDQSKFLIKKCDDDSEASTAPFNFVVADDSFRFEIDRDGHRAFASANNPDLAGKMSQKFEEFWNLKK